LLLPLRQPETGCNTLSSDGLPPCAAGVSDSRVNEGPELRAARDPLHDSNRQDCRIPRCDSHDREKFRPEARGAGPLQRTAGSAAIRIRVQVRWSRVIRKLRQQAGRGAVTCEMRHIAISQDEKIRHTRQPEGWHCVWQNGIV